jgi:hypothetical protein
MMAKAAFQRLQAWPEQIAQILLQEVRAIEGGFLYGYGAFTAIKRG